MSALYENDFVAWCKDQSEKLASHSSELDYENLIEEIEEMAKKHIRELQNRLIILIAHMIKMLIQPDLICNSWKSTIFQQRFHIQKLLSQNPSLKNILTHEVLEESHKYAYELASLETGFAEDDIKVYWFDWDEILKR